MVEMWEVWGQTFVFSCVANGNGKRGKRVWGTEVVTQWWLRVRGKVFLTRLWNDTSYEMLCMIWYHLYNLQNVKNTHEGVLLLVKFQAKSNTPLWVFFTLIKLYKLYQIAKSTTYLLIYQCFENLYSGDTE